MLWLLLVGIVVSNVAAFSLGKYWGLYLVYRASRDGKIAVVKLPSKSEVEGLLKKALASSSLPPAPKPKTDLPN